MYDHDEEPADPDERPRVDWDAWEKNRMTGYTRWWMILMAVMTIGLIIRFFQSGGSMVP